MSSADSIRGRAVVVQPGEGPSYWQPVPANGHADPALFPGSTGFDGLSMGFQSVAPGGRIREHSHGEQVELQICFRGRGRVIVDGAVHRLVPGTACFLGCDVKHEIVNDGEEDLGAARAREVLRGDREGAAGRRGAASALRAAHGHRGDRARARHERHGALGPRAPIGEAETRYEEPGMRRTRRFLPESEDFV
jgi:uncharacterized cupin superfamily protein